MFDPELSPQLDVHQQAEAIALHTWHVGWGGTDPQHFAAMVEGFYADTSPELLEMAWAVLLRWLADRRPQAL